MELTLLAAWSLFCFGCLKVKNQTLAMLHTAYCNLIIYSTMKTSLLMECSCFKPACPCLQVTCCTPCSTLSVTWPDMGFTRERSTHWCTTTTLTGLSQCCCWIRYLGICASTYTPSRLPAKERPTSPVSRWFCTQNCSQAHSVETFTCVECKNKLLLIVKGLTFGSVFCFLFMLYC